MKLDLHVHTTASDGTLSPREVLKEAGSKGLDGIAVTDHNTVEGCKEAKVYAEERELFLIQGIEVSTDKGHVLVLGVEEEPRSTKFEEVLNFAAKNDALTVGAHPFARTRTGIEPNFLKKLDAVEVLNGRTFPGGNEKARSFATEKELPQVAGSDAHIREELGNQWTEVEGENVKEILRNLKKGKTEVKGENTNRLSLAYHKFKTFVS